MQAVNQSKVRRDRANSWPSTRVKYSSDFNFVHTFKGAVFVVDSGIPLQWSRKIKGPKIVLPGGERSKDWKTLESILLFLTMNQVERNQTLVVIGGGAICDVGAFAASLYRRGMGLVLIPTTLLSMLDASVGGKTAINFSSSEKKIKNFAGTFYPAKQVWIVPSFLGSLSRRERLSGIGELVKMLWIAGRNIPVNKILPFLEEGKVDKDFLSLVRQSIQEKTRIVARDPLDKLRIREILNFGHTVGHMIEAGSGMSHGEAVLWGLAIELRLVHKSLEMEKLIQNLGLSFPKTFFLSREKMLDRLKGDKKMNQGKIELTIVGNAGLPKRMRVSPGIILNTFRDFILEVGSD